MDEWMDIIVESCAKVNEWEEGMVAVSGFIALLYGNRR